MIVTFIGHSSLMFGDEQKRKIEEAIVSCIKNGADTFYCGGYGSFDFLCANTVNRLKISYPKIKSYLIIPYVTQTEKMRMEYEELWRFFDGTIYPGIETVPLKYAILKRNEWMVDQASVVVAFVSHRYGGAYIAYQVAVRKRKHIINLSQRFPKN